MEKKRGFQAQPGFDAYLKNAYCVERKTMAQIAGELGCSVPTVLNHLRRCGIESRSVRDYPTTERKREAWRKIGRAGKGRELTPEHRAAIAAAARARRKRDDYEFGGHEKKRADGYIKVYVPDHPNSTADGYVMKHILVMEREIGRHLLPGEVVHHKNRTRDDNRIENLQLMTASEHMSMHMRERHTKGA